MPELIATLTPNNYFPMVTRLRHSQYRSHNQLRVIGIDGTSEETHHCFIHDERIG